MRILMQDHGRWADTGDHAFQAVVAVFRETGELVYTTRGSTFPNPFDPNDRERRLTDAYGCLAPGRYRWQYHPEGHQGEPGLILNANGRCQAAFPNPNQDGQLYLDYVHIHSAWSDTWRGSAGCPTIIQTAWQKLLQVVEGQDGFVDIEHTQAPVQRAA